MIRKLDKFLHSLLEYLTWHSILLRQFFRSTRRRHIRPVWSNQNTHGEIKRASYAVEVCNKRYDEFDQVSMISEPYLVRELISQDISTVHTSFDLLIDHFTVVRLVTWPLNGCEAEVTLFWYRPHYFYCANQDVLMPTSWYLHEKSREVCIKSRSSPASLVFMAR